MTDIHEDLDTILASTAYLLDTTGLKQASDVLRMAEVQLEKTGYDNWNGGINIYTLYLQIETKLYVQLRTQRTQIELQINNGLEAVLKQRSSNQVSAVIIPLMIKNPEWRSNVDGISKSVRQDIIDIYRVNKISWYGELDDLEFLTRLFDLKSLPSNDSRFQDAAGDIWQHRINNPLDWDDDWIFNDERFNLLNGSYETFLNFICETVHPIIRKDSTVTENIVTQINKILGTCEWELYKEKPIAGKFRYKARKISSASKHTVTRAKVVADALNAGWMHQEIQRLEKAVEEDPALAIGTAKELIETCCKTILGKLQQPIPEDFSDLTKTTVKALKLVPEGISDAAKGARTIKPLLSNLITIPNKLAELRSLYGTGHGRDGKHRGLETRHARLAVGAAVTFIDFVTDTYHQRELQNSAPVISIAEGE